MQSQFTNVVTVRNNVMKAQKKRRTKTTANDECSGRVVVDF